MAPAGAIPTSGDRLQQQHRHCVRYQTDSGPYKRHDDAPIPLEIDIMKKLFKPLSLLFLTLAIASMLACAASPKHEGTGEYVDDSVITTKVKAAIFNEPTLKSAEINVETFKGVVQLSGFVNSIADINKAVSITRSVKGVVSVKNDMRLKPGN